MNKYYEERLHLIIICVYVFLRFSAKKGKPIIARILPIIVVLGIKMTNLIKVIHCVSSVRRDI